MCRKYRLYVALCFRCFQTINFCDHFIIVFAIFFQTFFDTISSFFQNLCWRISDNCNLCFIICCKFIVDKFSCCFTNLFTKLCIVQYPVSRCVFHRVIPAHYFNISIKCFFTDVLYCFCIRRVNHDQVTSRCNEVLDLANLCSRVVFAIDQCIIPAFVL